MIPLTVTVNCEKTPWEDLREDCPQLGFISRIGRLPRGTVSGASSVTVLVEMPDGTKCE